MLFLRDLLLRTTRVLSEGNVLLKMGVMAMSLALVLAVGVAAVIWLRAQNNPAPATASADQLSAEAEQQQQREKEFDAGKKLELDDEPSEEQAETLPVSTEPWPQPSGKQVAATRSPRYYAPQRDAQLTLTIDALGLHNVPVINSRSVEALDRGVIHLPETPMPWEERGQKNVFLAGHRLGWPGTGSHMVFFNLDKLKKGDEIVLRDGAGTPYRYRATEMFTVPPNAEWAIDPVRGRDMVTLQTCTYPDIRNRIIVRADRV